MSIIYYLLLLGIISSSLYLILKIITSWPSVRNSKEKTTLPPGPPKWPIFGNLLQLGQLPHRDLASLCERYGPLVYIRLGRVDAITTNDPDIIREILRRQDDVFASRPRTLAAEHLAYGCGDVALAPVGPKWKRLRRICMEHLLTTKRLDSFASRRAEEAQHLVRDVWAMSRHGAAVNLREVLGAFSMNNVTRMLLGKQYFGADESAGPQEAMEFMHITHELFWLLGLIYLGDYLPIWRWIDPFGCEKRMREVEKRVDDFHAKIIEQHRKKRRENDGEVSDDVDFVDVLLSLPGEDGKENMDDVEIKALIQDMIAAATDTSAVTNEWAMAEVIKHPHVLKKAQQELDSVVGPNRMVQEPDLLHLNYLRCIVRETFRMHPAGPFLIPHESTRPTKINGYYIPEKTRVFINTHGLGRNTKIWDNVDEFKPDRHFPADGSRVEISHGADFKILPFSAGKRKCPGAPLGVTLVLMALARLLHAFDWSPAEGLRPEDIDTTEVYVSVQLTQAQSVMILRRVASKLKPLQRSRFFSSDSSHDLSKAIVELNQEMESVFGEPPASGPSGSTTCQTVTQESNLRTNDSAEKESFTGLTHIGSEGEARMVDISSKDITERVAVASCKVILGRRVFDLVSANQMEKGDVLGVARIAGICGAKQTSSLIPLCHNISMSHVHVGLKLNTRDFSVEIEGRAVSTGRTGVEMEALTAVTVAGLTVYDMCKAGSKDIRITEVRLEHKSGGKSGEWSRKV
ncbi:hypothetical protein OROMI_014151 [Orobanche minor]